MGENRIEVRERSFISAHIVYDSGNATVDCIIREISASGMRLEVNDSQSIPTEFDLHVPRRGSLYRVRVAWRDPVMIGVEITNNDPKSPRPKTSPDAQRLERENSMLRARLDDALARLRNGEIAS